MRSSIVEVLDERQLLDLSGRRMHLAVDVLSDLSAVPFMGSIEIRNGPLGLLGDALHVPLGTGITTPRDLFSGGHAERITDTGTALLLSGLSKGPTRLGSCCCESGLLCIFVISYQSILYS